MAANHLMATMERNLLQVLRHGPVVGLRTLAEITEGRLLRSAADVGRLVNYVSVMRHLEAQGALRMATNASSVRVTVTRKGRRLLAPQGESLFSRVTNIAAVAAVAALAGCAVPETVPARKPLMGFPTVTGLGQVRDPQTGATYFVPCDPCAAPSIKTPVGIAIEENLVPRQVPAARSQEQTSTRLLPALAPVVPRSEAVPVPNPAIEPSPGFVLFDTASAQLGANGLAVIKSMVPYAMGAESIVIRGQADNTGNIAGNRRLALARALAVRMALINAGVPAIKIKAMYCTTCYTASNDTEDGRKQNRRAEISLSHAKSSTTMR